MLGRAIESVLSQESVVPEIVVVDDGSVDDTIDFVKTTFPSIRLLRLAGDGPGPARNAGVAASTGDLMMFLDSDDIWRPRHVLDLWEVINRGFEVVYGVCYNVDQVNGGDFLIPASGTEVEGECFDQIGRWCFMVPSAMAVSRRAFTAVGGFPGGGPGEIGEDWAFFLKLAACFPFGFKAGPPVTTRYLHENSLCAMTSREKILASLRRLRRIVEHEKNDRARVLSRFLAMEQWVIAKGEKWTTVQEWYLSMKQGGLI